MSENTIQEGELAVKLTSDISGGVGSHSKGKVLRDLSASAFNTLRHTGFADVLEPGAVVPDEGAPAPVGAGADVQPPKDVKNK